MKKLNNKKHFDFVTLALTSLLITLVIVYSLFVLQVRIDDERQSWNQEEELMYLPSGKVLKIVSLGFDEVVADILFIRMIDYFGKHSSSDRTYVWLYHMADLVTDLDPKFRFPYIFAGLMLNLEANQFDNARKIIIKGMNQFPNNWYFPFTLGINYFFHDGDFLRAADSLEDASKLPDAPDYLIGFAKKLRKKAATKEEALDFLKHLDEVFGDESISAILKERIKEIEERGVAYD